MYCEDDDNFDDKISDLSGLNNPKLSALTICHNNLNSMPNVC